MGPLPFLHALDFPYFLYPKKFFAVQHQGWCAAAKNFLGYKKYGKSNACKNGKGGPWANDVYRITNPLKPGKPGKPASKPASIKVLFGNWNLKFPKVKFNLVFKS